MKKDFETCPNRLITMRITLCNHNIYTSIFQPALLMFWVESSSYDFHTSNVYKDIAICPETQTPQVLSRQPTNN